MALSNAQTDLDEKERLELLDEFARLRRDLIPDAMRYIARPIAMAIIASVLVSSSRLSWTKKSVFYIGQKLMNVSFWWVTVAVPLVMHTIVKRKKPERRRKSEWDAEYIDPRQDCSDYARCLLENWALAIYPTTAVGVITILSLRFNLLKGESSLLSWRLATLLSQLVTRLGAAMSVHQFPKYLYELRKENDKCPTPLLPSALQSLINLSLWILPLGFAADVSQLYTCGMKMGCGWDKKLFSMAEFWGGSRAMTAICYSVLASSLLMQLCQFIGFKKLFRVGYFTNISLATSNAKVRALLLQDPNALNVVKLRYRLHWREPKRLFSSFHRMAHAFTLFLFTGWGEDASVLEESTSEPHLLKLIKRDMDLLPGVKPDRSTWVPNATQGMARIHQEDYDKKSFQDPLGIALQQTFGIGLSFDFDHDVKLRQGATLTVHRLRARAAKSAIKRYNRIPDIIKEEVENIADDVERENLAKNRIDEERTQLKVSVNRLLSLIPTNAPAPEGKNLDVLSMRQSEVNSLQTGAANLPFLNNEDPINDDGDDFIVTDPYLDDDIFSRTKTVFT